MSEGRTTHTLVERLEALCSDAVTGIPDTAILAMRAAAARIRVLEEALRTIERTDEKLGFAIGAPAQCAQIARQALSPPDTDRGG